MSMLDPKTSQMFYFTGKNHTTPNCPLEMVPNFNPSAGVPSYRSSDRACSKNAKYYIPFFLERPDLDICSGALMLMKQGLGTILRLGHCAARQYHRMDLASHSLCARHEKNTWLAQKGVCVRGYRKPSCFNFIEFGVWFKGLSYFFNSAPQRATIFLQRGTQQARQKKFS